MAVSVENFITPEQDFRGLHHMADKMDRKTLRDDQLREHKNAKRAANAKFFADYLDPKDHLTGTNYDPQIVSGLNTLLGEAAALSNEGADTNMILMALTPKVKRIHEYASTAKLVNQRLKDQLSKIKPGTGYDIPALEQEARRTAFYNPDGTFKDISQVDPNTDWVSEVVKTSPEKVTTDAGIDEFVKNSPKFTNTKDITAYTPSGGMNRKKVKITAPNWLTQDIDEKGAMTGLVPKYQVALDGGQPQMHEFTGKDGKKVKAPVRLLDENEFKSIMSSNPGIADWVRGQVRSAMPDTDLNSPQAANAARAILYDELKRRMPGGVEDVEVQNKPSTYEIKNYLGIPQTKSGGGDGATTNDVYGRIKKEVQRMKEYGEKKAPAAVLDLDGKNYILDFINKDLPQDGKFTSEDIQLQENDNGEILVFAKGALKGALPEAGLNLRAQPNVKAKVEVVQKANQNQPKSKKQSPKFPLPSGKPRVVKQGKYTYTWDENTGEYK